MIGLQLAEELCRAQRDSTTGVVEWRDEKRRRLFFFRGGVLVLIQSNLKSESPERVAERYPTVASESLTELVAAVRLREAIGERVGEVVLHSGAGAPGFEALDLVALLWEATDRLPPLAPDAWPSAVPAGAPLLARIPAGPAVLRYLLELDGTRPLDEVLEFAPEDPEEVARALVLAHALGAVTSGGGRPPVVTPSPAAATDSGGPNASVPTAPVPTAPGRGGTSVTPTPPPPTAPQPPAPASPPAAPAPDPLTARAPTSPEGATTARAAPPSSSPRATDPLTVDDLADLIRGALDDAPRPAAHPGPTPASPPTAAPSPTSAAAPFSPAPPQPASVAAPSTPGLRNPAEDASSRGPSPGEEPPVHFGGASATVTLDGGRARVTHESPEADPAAAAHAEALAAFGPALDRILAAKDHFAVLGTGWKDAPETHRRAYFTLAQRLHPDRLRDQSEAVRSTGADLFDLVRAAWEVLGDDQRREAYIAKVIRGEKSEDELAMEKVRRILDAENEFKRGLAELSGGRLPAAHEFFVRAAGAVPEEIEFVGHAAYTTFRLAHGRDEAAATEAAKRLADALQANEKFDSLWVLFGVVSRMMGREAAARQAFITALKLKPSNPDALREMKRLDREKDAAQEAASGGGFLSKLFKKK